MLIERGEDVLRAPAAHVINTRTMEIFAQLGLPVEELYGLNRHPHAHKISWLATLQSPVLGVAGVKICRDSSVGRATDS